MSCPDTKPGHPDIYGLGIRLSFYLLWFAVIAFNWLPVHLRGGFVALRIMHLVFSFAVFIGLAGAISSSSPGPLGSSESDSDGPEPTFHLDNGEVYIALLLVSSGIYLLVPLYLCRATTGCLHCCGSGGGCHRGCGGGAWGQQTDYLLARNTDNPHRKGRGSSSWDGVGGLVPLLEFIFLMLAGGLQCWFWWSGVDYPSLSDRGSCGDEPSSGYGYGFLFGRVDLGDSRFRGFNSMVVLAVLIGAVVFSVIDAGICGGGGGNGSSRRKKRKRRKRQTRDGLAFLRGIQTVFSLGVVVTLLVAIELSIQWNGISDGVNQVTVPAQLMPLLITITLVLIVILHSLTADGGYEDGGNGSSTGYGSSKSGRSGSGSGSGGSNGSSSSKGSSSGSSRSGGRGGSEVVDPWNRVPNPGGGGRGQGFVPPPPFPPAQPGFAGVPPGPFPPPGAAGAAGAAPGVPPLHVAQLFPVFPPRVNVNTVLVEPKPEPMEKGITEAGSSSSTSSTRSSPSSSGHDDIENGSITESIADSGSEEEEKEKEEGRKSMSTSHRSRRPIDASEKGDHSHNHHSPSRASGEREQTGQKAGFDHPPAPINMPFGRSMPIPTSTGFGGGVGGGTETERFPPPAWPPGWSGQRESRIQAPPPPPPPFFRPEGFPPAPPMPAFMPPGGVSLPPF